MDRRANRYRFSVGDAHSECVGRFAIGVMATLADQHVWISPAARLLLIPGLLGGYTTFSTFGLETWQSAEDGFGFRALINAAASLTICLVAVAAGVQFTRQLT